MQVVVVDVVVVAQVDAKEVVVDVQDVVDARQLVQQVVVTDAQVVAQVTVRMDVRQHVHHAHLAVQGDVVVHVQLAVEQPVVAVRHHVQVIVQAVVDVQVVVQVDAKAHVH